MSNDKPGQWFGPGERVPYNPAAKKIVGLAHATDAGNSVHVWRRVVPGNQRDDDAVWTTFLHGFPDGSIGWRKVDGG